MMKQWDISNTHITISLPSLKPQNTLPSVLRVRMMRISILKVTSFQTICGVACYRKENDPDCSAQSPPHKYHQWRHFHMKCFKRNSGAVIPIFLEWIFTGFLLVMQIIWDKYVFFTGSMTSSFALEMYAHRLWDSQEWVKVKEKEMYSSGENLLIYSSCRSLPWRDWRRKVYMAGDR